MILILNLVVLGNTNVSGNLNIINKMNVNIPHLFLNTIGIGTNIIDGDFIVKNNTNTIFIHKNNKIGIGTNIILLIYNLF